MADNRTTPSTDNFREYPKGPNFGLIVALACVALLVVLFAGWIFLRHDAGKVAPKGEGNPKPINSRLVMPVMPRGTPAQAV